MLDDKILSIFPDFTTLLQRKRKNAHRAVNENRRTEKNWTLFYNRLFYKALQNDNHFFFNRSFCLQDIYWFRKLVRSTIFAL